MAYRVVPYKVDRKTPLGYAVDIQKTDSLFYKVFKFRGLVGKNEFFIDGTHQRLLSNYRAPLMVLAIEYFNRGEIKKAIENIEFALNFEGNRDLMDKDDKRIVYFMRLQLAQFAIAGGKYDKAISVCKELIKEEKNSVVYTLMGDAYRGTGEKELAKKYYKLALELPPAFIKTYESMIEMYIQDNEKDSAKQIFQLAEKRFGKTPILDSLREKYKID